MDVLQATFGEKAAIRFEDVIIVLASEEWPALRSCSTLSVTEKIRRITICPPLNKAVADGSLLLFSLVFGCLSWTRNHEMSHRGSSFWIIFDTTGLDRKDVRVTGAWCFTSRPGYFFYRHMNDDNEPRERRTETRGRRRFETRCKHKSDVLIAMHALLYCADWTVLYYPVLLNCAPRLPTLLEFSNRIE